MNKLVLIICIALTFVVSSPVWACGAVESSIHVGNVLKIDNSEKTFTILDVQTVSPITFQANEEILAKVKTATGSVVVDYVFEGLDLIATNVELN